MASKIVKDNIKSKLNDKQKLFCVEYLKDLNITQAYKRVYNCAEEEASASGSRLLGNVNIKKYINDLLEEYKDNCDITIGEIVDNIKKIALDDEARHSDKLKALELLARYKQMFIEKKELTINDNSNKLSEEDINKQLEELGVNVEDNNTK
ncbi:terminase small subunit [Clostridium sp. KNHs214]|uniref:terminase small subunit n=1 Tax=Clostridium sp. KNHs214 TaxID=1540257 RepID=UPI00069223C2|nr:terminase small subunit [Clostridium sp. KNHs214]